MRNFLESESIPHKFSEFDMVTTLEHDPGNPLHNYHINCDGKKVLTNGTGLLLHTYTLEIYLN